MAAPAHWRPRLIALDIDGTVCAEGMTEEALIAHHTISPAVRNAIAAVLATDTHLVLCSGRSMLGVRPFLAEFGVRAGTAICSNGAVWLDAATGEVTSSTQFELTEPVAVLRAALPGAVFVVEEIGVGNRVSGPVRDMFFGEARLVDFTELVATPTTRMTVFWPDRTAAELLATLDGVALPGVQCTMDHSNAVLFAAPAGVTKGSALEKLRVRLGVSERDTMAVGDGTNDVEMLTWAAHGVAMGQAPEVVRRAADEVVAPVTEDGLATLLARWFD